MSAYYNEFEPYAAQWLRNLIAAGHIADGEVDERSIKDVRADELAGFTQCHFFAGIAGWSAALRLAGWPDSRPVWTGSCPCQPFSGAGKGKGFDDERHLWPEWFRLIRECQPATVFGEQVDAAVKHGWLDLVQSDLEGIGYAFAPVCIPAGSVGAPHIRQRLWFVADCDGAFSRHEELWERGHDVIWRGRNGKLENSIIPRLEGYGVGYCTEEGRQGAAGSVTETGEFSGVAHTDNIERRLTPPGHDDDRAASEWAQGNYGSGVANTHWLHQHAAGAVKGFWRDADWLLCRDERFRPVEPGTFPLDSRIPGRVGRLRAYGNAIVPQVAAEVISAFMECRP